MQTDEKWDSIAHQLAFACAVFDITPEQMLMIFENFLDDFEKSVEAIKSLGPIAGEGQVTTGGEKNAER